MSGIYIHWPYCLSKCYYCDFYSIKCSNTTVPTSLYINVLRAFINTFYHNEKITSIYFGGGTPSLASIDFFRGILEFIFSNFKIDNNIEITLEANPKTINVNKATALKQLGINRLSIGVQSILDCDLKMLGRIHNSIDALCCVHDMASIFNNVSIDIIYNRPGQTLKSWQLELNEILKLPIQHISLYELIVEQNTYMHHLIKCGILPSPSISSNFLQKTINIMKQKGWEMYEVSNFTKNNNYCRHNLSYWKYNNYYGIGASSHSRVVKNGIKYAIEQSSDIKKWSQWAKNPKFHIGLTDRQNISSCNRSMKDYKSNFTEINSPVQQQSNLTLNNKQLLKNEKRTFPIISDDNLKETSNESNDSLENNNKKLVNIEKLSREEQDIERLLMGLRTKFGVQIRDFSQEFIDKYRIFEKLKILQQNHYAYGSKGNNPYSSIEYNFLSYEINTYFSYDLNYSSFNIYNVPLLTLDHTYQELNNDIYYSVKYIYCIKLLFKKHSLNVCSDHFTKSNSNSIAKLKNHNDKIILTTNGIMKLNLVLQYLIQN